MSDKPSTRKIAFTLYPDDHEGDKLASALLDETRVKERGRAMRAFLLTGAALAAVDRRLPNLIAELASEHITLQDIQRIISNVIPEAFAPDDAMMRAVLARLGQPELPAAPDEKPAQPAAEDKKIAETRNNSANLFPDD